jgi:hypothetical protein
MFKEQKNVKHSRRLGIRGNDIGDGTERDTERTGNIGCFKPCKGI